MYREPCDQSPFNPCNFPPLPYPPPRPINRQSPGSMGSTTENINWRVETAIPMARFSIGDDDDDEQAPVTVKRPRFSDAASQSRVVAEENDEDEVQVVIEDVESDSEGSDYEEDNGYEELEAEEDDEEPVPEGQNHTAVANRTVPTGSPVVNSAIGGLQAVLTDPDVLDCPICLEPLSTPVFQCENGHIACSSCCSKVNRKCPSCCMPIGYNRCRAVEKIIESVKVSCKNAQYGCKKTITYNNKTEHEQTCPHATCFCPHLSCPFTGSSKNLYLHFGIQHAGSTTRFTYNTTFVVHVKPHQKHIFLQEQQESVVFILNHEFKQHGWALSIDCVGPSTLKACFEYHITARKLGSTLYLQSVPEVYTKWYEHSLRKNYLTIPSDFFCGTETLPVHLCIKKVVSLV